MELPWRLSSDLKRFKRLTMGHCLLMGRKTFESIGRPLPGRKSFVLSRQSDPKANFADVTFLRSLDEVEALIPPDKHLMVIGGSQIFELAWHRCTQLWLTRVQADVEGDVYLPPIDWSQWSLISATHLEAGEKDQWPTEFQQWKRRPICSPQ